MIWAQKGAGSNIVLHCFFMNLFLCFPSSTVSSKSHISYSVFLEVIPEDHIGTTSLPVQWRSWLSYQRKEAPSLEELTKSRQHQEWLKGRVQELEQEEEKLRLQEKLDHQRGKKSNFINKQDLTQSQSNRHHTGPTSSNQPSGDHPKGSRPRRATTQPERTTKRVGKLPPFREFFIRRNFWSFFFVAFLSGLTAPSFW
eukprot:TRINITY_DN738_c0_g1_i2.p1 TRINITY_DN738_c0_g1~~TRINITY_DN738_c0_g1_i2.p1  ORF type:complete len:198 (-),score=21.91 TRINITY_DN738_c0_g1_i2:57-650(-)